MWHYGSTTTVTYCGSDEDSSEDNVSVERIVILDKLPEGATDSKLAELIPEAIEIIDLNLFEESQG